jgi:molybdenum cofactor cytidylyltransferase
VVLAAGRGLRFGGDTPKPLVSFHGQPLVMHAVGAATRSGLAPVVVVVSDDRVAATLESRAGGAAVQLVRNDAPERGIASSLHAALRRLEPDETVDAVVVGLADQPLVGADAYRRVAHAYDDGARLAVATYGGARGNPVLIGRAHWREALALAGDEGARVLLRKHGAVEVPCDGTGESTDVDTPEDLAALESRTSKNDLSNNDPSDKRLLEN